MYVHARPAVATTPDEGGGPSLLRDLHTRVRTVMQYIPSCFAFFFPRTSYACVAPLSSSMQALAKISFALFADGQRR